MDFLGSYSYGYDQVSVEPAHSADYDDSEFRLAQNRARDLSTKTLQEWTSASQKNVQRNPYADRGIDQRDRMNYVINNLEDIARPPDVSPYHDRDPDRVLACRQEPRSAGSEPNAGVCQSCRSSRHQPSNDSTQTTYLLLIIVIVMSVLCMYQHSNTYSMNSALIDMIRNQPTPPAWLRLTPSESGTK